jgi:hypothetical protein
MFSVEITGRLVQIRLSGVLTAESVARFVETTRMVLLRAPAKIVGISDLRQCMVMPPAAADMIVTMLIRDSPKVERSAIWLSRLESGLAMQFARILRESRSQVRELFEDPTRAAEFLADSLTLTEQTALERFFAD